ncbi:hypothetical protein HCN44_003359 [Aphidius gifuensis]|uniref:Uncharacterized protein n=1 Tax=Aphidius gifuensis TaxID=684658 RepID=A0A834XZW3_APHGI|nr:hypothetical protein HCN44_003359 [Aphidius gifuensis]
MNVNSTTGDKSFKRGKIIEIDGNKELLLQNETVNQNTDSGSQKTSKAKSFALVWYVDEPYKDVLDIKKIPKSQREVGKIVKIKWHNASSGKDSIVHDKIIRISDNEKELNELALDENGIIRSNAVQLHSSEVIDDIAELKKNKKLLTVNIKKNKINSNSMIGQVSPLFTRTNGPKNSLLKTKNHIAINSLVEFVPPPPPGFNDDSCREAELNLSQIKTFTNDFCVETSSNLQQINTFEDNFCVEELNLKQINTFQSNEEPPCTHVEQPILLGSLLSDTNTIISDQQDFPASSQLLESLIIQENPCYLTGSWDQYDVYDHHVKDTSSNRKPCISDENEKTLYTCDSSKHSYTECQTPSSSKVMDSKIQSEIKRQLLDDNDEPEEEQLLNEIDKPEEELDNLTSDEETISELCNQEIEPRELCMLLNHESPCPPPPAFPLDAFFLRSSFLSIFIDSILRDEPSRILL